MRSGVAAVSVLLLGGAARPLVPTSAAVPAPVPRVVPMAAEAWSGSSVNVVADQFSSRRS